MDEIKKLLSDTQSKKGAEAPFVFLLSLIKLGHKTHHAIKKAH